MYTTLGKTWTNGQSLNVDKNIFGRENTNSAGFKEQPLAVKIFKKMKLSLGLPKKQKHLIENIYTVTYR